ncbi:hypothetical protein GCM10023195_11970 [Actinoallomurus liliacearum]|uniref:Uncharacterized protein n=1 Tax=Actinoallomurus liliacearum TaxID=1080073 RepID=A0ABP8TF94_9ACTN
MTDAQDEQRGGQHGGRAARDQHLAEGGSPGRFRLDGEEAHRRSAGRLDQLLHHTRSSGRWYASTNYDIFYCYID